MIATTKKSFRLLNWKLLLVIFITLLIPVIYRTVRIYIIGTLPDTFSTSIASHLVWINVLFEVLEEAFLLPLFFALSKFRKTKEENSRITGKTYIIILIYMALIIIFVSTTKQMMDALSISVVGSSVIKFVRIEFITRLFVMLFKICTVLLMAKDRIKELIIFLVISTLLNIIFDTFLVANNEASLHLGIMWIGWNQMITNVIMVVIGFAMIIKTYRMKFDDFIHPIFRNASDTWKENIIVGIESFIRNAFFLWFVIKTINKMPGNMNQTNFWLMNTFIWSWLLLPILALSQYINKDTAFRNDEINTKERLTAPFVMVAVVVIIWLILIPAYAPFIHHVMNTSDYEQITHLTLISLGFYITFAFNEIIDKIFLGNGKAAYILIQSVIVNIVVYIPYYYGTTSITLEGVAIMMGTAILLDSAITIALFILWNFRNSKKKPKESFDDWTP